MGIFAVSDAPGSTPRAVTDVRTNKNDPAQSPDGSRIAFVNFSPNDRVWGTIWVVGTDGRDPHAITTRTGTPPGFELGGGDIQPTWSPDGSQIVFSSNRAGTYDLWSVADDGSGLRRLTSLPDDELSPQVSRDARHIRFVRSSPRTFRDRTDDGDIWSVDSAGTGAVALTTGGFVLGNAAFHFSPDDTQIAMSANPGLSFSTTTRVFTMNADGRDMRARTRNGDYGFDPAWSPDARSLVFGKLSPQPGDRQHETLATLSLTTSGAMPRDIVTPSPDHGSQFASPSWASEPVAAASAAAPADRLPPVIRLQTAPEGRRAARATRSSLRYYAIDRSGVRSVSVRVNRRGAPPRTTRLTGAASFKRAIRRLPPGRHTLRFSAADVRGNRGVTTLRVVLRR